MVFHKKKSDRGITLVETIIYSGILVIVLVFIVQTVISVVRSHRTIRLTQSLESSGALAMERILRETRNASSVVTIGSDFNSVLGTLKIAGKDENGNDYFLVFNVVNGVIMLSKDGGDPGPLTNFSDVSVDSLVFRHLSNSVTEGVRVEMSISGSDGVNSKTLDMYGFAVLRGSY